MYNKAEYAKWKPFERDMQNVEDEMLYGYSFNTRPDREYNDIEKLNELFSDKEELHNEIV